MREPRGWDPEGDQVVRLPAPPQLGRFSQILERLLVGPPTAPAARDRERAQSLRVLQRQLENARIYLAAAAQVEVDDLVAKRVARAEGEVAALVDLVTRRRNVTNRREVD
jgi:hypothetical protein